MTRLATVVLALAALIAGGYGMLRSTDVTDTAATPAAGPDESPAPVILWPETEDETESGPKRPLTTELAPEPLAETDGDIRAALAERPCLEPTSRPERSRGRSWRRSTCSIRATTRAAWSSAVG